jgi:YgiT-type zinc finger domain-containing protein
MTCVICKHGKTQPGTTRIAVERGATVLVVRGVPAQVCDTCGEAYLSGEAVDRLHEMLAIAAQGGVQVEVREYVAA